MAGSPLRTAGQARAVKKKQKNRKKPRKPVRAKNRAAARRQKPRTRPPPPPPPRRLRPAKTRDLSPRRRLPQIQRAQVGRELVGEVGPAQREVHHRLQE